MKSGGASKAAAHFETKEPAVGRARTLSENQRAELFIHNRNGQIGSRDSHGGDPRSRKG